MMSLSSIQFLMNELDPDNMGVILYHKFVETLFTPDQSYTPPDTFIIHHYNGLESSCPASKVRLRLTVIIMGVYTENAM